MSAVSLDSIATSVNVLPFRDYEGITKYIAVGDDQGRVYDFMRNGDVLVEFYTLSKSPVVRENGTLYGLAVPTSRPLVFLKQRLLFLMEKGAGSLDLRTMKIRETNCEGLNDSIVKNFVFDATERSKAYGFTSSGDFIHVLLLGDVMNFKCRVRSRKKVDMNEPLAFQAIKGYLLIIGQEKIYDYNVSTQHYVRSGAPRLTFSAGIEEIKSSFLPSQVVDENEPRENLIPLIASDREKLVILGLGGGYVGMYRSKLPVLEGESNTMLWTSPVLFFIVFLFGAWQFFAKKKEALTSWGPDDPFNSSGAALGSDRPFTDSSSSRSADIMDLRGNNGLRGGPSRRYTSPSRNPSGGPPRMNTVESGSRPSSVDPNYRATSELKFRASNLESSGFPNRRDGMFVSSQGVDDGS